MSAEQIPIANIYYLLCYALDHVQETQYADARTEGCDRMVDLLAKVLTRSTQQLIKRGLHRDYVQVREVRTIPKGKLLMAEEVRRPRFGSLARTCEFDELSADILPNRIIRATCEMLLRTPELKPEIRRELRDVFGFFAPFAAVDLNRRFFRQVHLHRNMRHYRFALSVCELIHNESLPTLLPGESRFRDFRRDDARMGALFEQFVRNFYAREQATYLVNAPQISWDLDPSRSTAGGRQLLPAMKTDICLESPRDKLIIDCKFYRDAFQRNFDRPKFISGNLYQIFAYLKNQERVAGWENARGMLLYPVISDNFDETVHLNGHELRVVSIDLRQAWQRISADLLALLDAPAVRSSRNPVSERN